MFFNITSYTTIVFIRIVRKQIYNFTHAISTTFMIKVKNTVVSTHVAPRTLQFMLIPYFDVVGFKIRNVQGGGRNYRKILLSHVTGNKMLSNAFPVLY